MISIDPGVDYYAMARWGPHGELRDVDVRPVDLTFMTDGLLVMERPRIRRFGKRRAPDELVITLALSAGRLSDRCHTEWVDAGVWTHGQSKTQRQPKALARLKPEEQALVLAHSKKEQDHILDAIGIGMYYLEMKGVREFICSP